MFIKKKRPSGERKKTLSFFFPFLTLNQNFQENSAVSMTILAHTHTHEHVLKYGQPNLGFKFRYLFPDYSVKCWCWTICDHWIHSRPAIVGRDKRMLLIGPKWERLSWLARSWGCVFYKKFKDKLADKRSLISGLYPRLHFLWGKPTLLDNNVHLL